MPLIECTIEREGPTVINDGGFTFTFEKNEHGHNVADVLAEGTAARLLTFSWFRKYRPKEDYPDPFEAAEIPPAAEQAKEASPQQQEPKQEEAPEPQTDDDSVKARILLLHGEGHSAKVIADAVAKTKSYVYKIIRENKRQ